MITNKILFYTILAENKNSRLQSSQNATIAKKDTNVCLLLKYYLKQLVLVMIIFILINKVYKATGIKRSSQNRIIIPKL